MKKLLYTLYQKLVNLLWGTGLGKVPPIYWMYSFAFKLLRPSEDIIEIEGSKMYSSTSSLPVSYNRAFQAYIVKEGWEPETTRLFRKLAKEGDIIIDIGANIGYFTLLAAKIVGDNGKVYAFEPDTTNYNILTSNIELNALRNTITVQKAVSDRNGKLEFYLNDSDIGAHTIYKSNKAKRSIIVNSVTLDEYFKGREYPIDIVKMDVEGAESAVLSGMSKIIEQNKDLKIFAEFHPPWIKRAGISPEYFVSQLLNHYRFNIVVIQDYTRHIKSGEVKNYVELMNICRHTKIVNLLLERRVG